MGLFNWPSRQNKPKEEKYVPPLTNRHAGGRKTTEEFEDAYTRGHVMEKQALADTDNFFTDAEGRRTPISQMNGQTKQLLKEARKSIQAEIKTNKNLAKTTPAGTEEETVEEAKSNALNAGAIKNRKLKSIDKFYSGHARLISDGSRVGSKVGLYKDYDPKLNAGAPGNREERYRQARQLAEKNKGLESTDEKRLSEESLFYDAEEARRAEEKRFYDNIPDIKTE